MWKSGHPHSDHVTWVLRENMKEREHMPMIFSPRYFTSHCFRAASRQVFYPQGSSFISNIWNQLASSSKSLFSVRWSICQYPSGSIASINYSLHSLLRWTSLLDGVMNLAYRYVLFALHSALQVKDLHIKLNFLVSFQNEWAYWYWIFNLTWQQSARAESVLLKVFSLSLPNASHFHSSTWHAWFIETFEYWLISVLPHFCCHQQKILFLL